MRCERGFTLIELLVAISLLVVVAVMGWRGLDAIVRARGMLESDMRQMHGLQLTFAQLQSDCAQLATPSELPGHQTLVAREGSLVLLRAVTVDDQPSRYEVVSYRLHAGELTRRESTATRDLAALDLLWQAALAGADSSGAVALQDGISALNIRAWQDGGWTSGVMPVEPPAAATAAGAGTATSEASPPPPAPTALEVELHLGGRETGLLKVLLVGAM